MVMVSRSRKVKEKRRKKARWTEYENLGVAQDDRTAEMRWKGGIIRTGPWKRKRRSRRS